MRNWETVTDEWSCLYNTKTLKVTEWANSFPIFLIKPNSVIAFTSFRRNHENEKDAYSQYPFTLWFSRCREGSYVSRFSLSYLRDRHMVTLCALVAHSCPTLCDPMVCRPSGSSVHGTFQAKILKWVAFPSPRDLPDPGIKPGSPALQADSLLSEPPGKPDERECFPLFQFHSTRAKPFSSFP